MQLCFCDSCLKASRGPLVDFIEMFQAEHEHDIPIGRETYEGVKKKKKNSYPIKRFTFKQLQYDRNNNFDVS